MTDDERFALVEHIRAVQTRFFRGDKSVIAEARRLEVAVDAMLKDRKEGPGLFGPYDHAEERRA